MNLNCGSLLFIGALLSGSALAQDQSAQRPMTPREQALRDCHKAVKAQASARAMENRQRMTAMTECLQAKREVAASEAEQKYSKPGLR